MKKYLLYLIIFCGLVLFIFILPIILYFLNVPYEWYIPMFVTSDNSTTINIDGWNDYTIKDISIKIPPHEISVNGTRQWKLWASAWWQDIPNRPTVSFSLSSSFVGDPNILIEIISFSKSWFPNERDYREYNLDWNGVRCLDDIFWRSRIISGHVFKYQICTEGFFSSKPNIYYHDRYLYETSNRYYMIDISKWFQKKISSEVQSIVNTFLKNIKFSQDPV